MTHASLFSGIGGFDIAAHWMGWQNVLHCEINPFCQRILKYYWPNATSYSDIKATDFSIHRGTIDILTGGFPCQPYSTAGKRLGKEDERHLWPDMLRAIREIQPAWVVGENVRGLTNWNGGLVFDEVQSDLEAIGYEVTPFILPACSVNAPHRRDRIWFIAYSHRLGREGQQSKQLQRAEQIKPPISKTKTRRAAANNTNTGVESMQQSGQNGVYGFIPSSYTQDNRRKRESRRRGIGGKRRILQKGFATWCEFIRSRTITTDTSSKGLSRSICRKQRIIPEEASSLPGSELGRTYAAPNGWEGFPTQSPVCSRNDGVPSGLDIDAVYEGVGKPKKSTAFGRWRNESIKGYGNAIVPQVAYEIFKVVDHMQKNFTT